MSAMIQTNDIPCQALRIRVRGRVQGVGFRPTVWRLAQERGLTGQVRNDSEGVLIELHGPFEALDGFGEALRAASPPLAHIEAIEQTELPVSGEAPAVFSIAPSQGDQAWTGIPADAATCPDCLAEILDPGQRRRGYAFTNCTHCGPRLSIIRQIPYDRINTSMAGFDLCAACDTEYRNPADRRFHAQPIACADCGPRLWLCGSDGMPIATQDPITDAAQQIRQGAIVAIKGIGGYQLACDARNREAIERLRARKHRPHKPLALMARDLEQARGFLYIDDFSAQALTSPAAPILLLPRDSDCLPDTLAPNLDRLGVMLPNSPLHHLLLRQLDGPMVLTSGNRSGEPQCTGNDQALKRLGTIADLFLMHDREIINRVDDSVAQVVAPGGKPRLQWLRRARGLAPESLILPAGFEDAPNVLACGGEMKNTFCLLRAGEAIPSQYIGELQDAAAWQDYREQLTRYEQLWRFAPEAIAIDRHPQYLPSQEGRALAGEQGLPLFEIQHHHAHVAACLADNKHPLDGGAIIGIALDGLGLGDDGNLWGGEVLIADYVGYRRAAHLKPVPLPGGAQAMREPWRNAWAQLLQAGLMPSPPDTRREPLFHLLAKRPLATLEGMIKAGINAPLSSSCGRLFDAVAALLGLHMEGISYEGQAAIELEQLADTAGTDCGQGYPFAIGTPPQRSIDPAPMWQNLLDDLDNGVDKALIAARFHEGLCSVLIRLCRQLRAEDPALGTVALTGGVLQNRRLLTRLDRGLRDTGFRVYVHDRLPPNDGGLSVGQATIAAARLLKTRKGEPSPCV